MVRLVLQILMLFFVLGCSPAHLPLLQSVREGDMSRLRSCIADTNCKKQINDTELSGYTPLHVAAYTGNVQAVEILLEAGADVNALNELSNTPLIEAFPLYLKLSQNMIGRHLRIVESLVNAGADVTITNTKGNTPLHFAALNQIPDMVEVLIEAGADPNAVNNENTTPLMYSLEHDTHCIKTIDLLLSNGADLNAVDNEGKTVLVKALEGKDPAAITMLLERGADPKAKDTSGMDLFLHAGATGDLTLLDTLINMYPNWSSSRCNNGNTILHYLCEFGHTDGVTFILDKGFNINELNTMGENSLFTACRNHHLEVIDKLLNAGIDTNIRNNAGRYAFEMIFSQEKAIEVTDIQKNIIYALLDAGFSFPSDDEQPDESIKARFYFSAANYYVENNDEKKGAHFYEYARNSCLNASVQAQEYIEFLEQELRSQKRIDFWKNVAGYVASAVLTGASYAGARHTEQSYYYEYTYFAERSDTVTPAQYIKHIKKFKSNCESLANVCREKSIHYSK